MDKIIKNMGITVTKGFNGVVTITNNIEIVICYVN